MGQLIGAQGQVKVAKKMQKHHHLWRSPQQTPNQKQKNFFRCQLEDLVNPWRVWTAL